MQREIMPSLKKSCYDAIQPASSDKEMRLINCQLIKDTIEETTISNPDIISQNMSYFSKKIHQLQNFYILEFN